MTVQMVTRTFLRGLAVALPIGLTLLVFYWLAAGAERLFGGILKLLLPDVLYLPGMGVALGLAAVFLLGLLSWAPLFRAVGRWFERRVESIPGVKSIYGSVRDLISYFSRSGAERFTHAAMVRFGEQEILGLITRESFQDLPDGVGGEGQVAVYLPMSYQVGGFTVILPREHVRPIEMGFEDAMRFAFTAGVTRRDEKGGANKPDEPPSS